MDITNHLRQIIKQSIRHNQAVTPPAGIAIRAPRISNIHAVVFDVYGTLVHSAAGEISISEDTQETSIHFAHLNISVSSARVKQALRTHIQNHHAEQKQRGVQYPEVDIITMWERVIQTDDAFRTARGADIDKHAVLAALYYELAVNPVCLMPNAHEIISALRNAGVTLGIVSNAQFYTPLMLDVLLEDEWNREAFSAQVWSYKIREAKPSTKLYRELLHQLKTTHPHYRAENILFVGNDMRNDIAPPARLGIKTALFAGDECSYRPRDGLEDVRGITPDARITDLMSIKDIVGV